MAVLYIFLFLFSIITWDIKRWISLFCLILFSCDGLYIIPRELGGLKLTYLAFAYVLIVLIYKSKEVSILFRIHRDIAQKLFVLIVFFIVSILFSIFYYGFPPLLCFTTGIKYLVLLAFFIFPLAKKEELLILFRVLFCVTLITSALYIVQCFTGVQLLVYSLEQSENVMDNGLFRWYNFPPLAGIFLYVSFFATDIIPKSLRLISYVILPLALITNSGRAAMLTAGINFLVISYLIGSFKRNFRTIAIILVIFYFFSGMVFTRIENNGKTQEDLEMVIKGKFNQAGYHFEGGYTLLYRFAWVLERWEYLSGRPFVESLFGLGMITDESGIAHSRYSFMYGLTEKQTGATVQLKTPDIAWGNFLTCYGLLGSLLFFVFYFSIWKKFKFYSNRDHLSAIMTSYMLVLLLESFTGSTLSEPYSMMKIFFIYAIVIKSNRQMAISIDLKKNRGK